MDEGFDESVEPITDIPVEESADSLDETEQPISESEMAELQSEADALAIEPFAEENNDDYFEIKGENSHSLGGRIVAGILAGGAPFAAGIESAAPVQNMEQFGAPTEIRIDAPNEIKTPEQVLEEFNNKPSPLQTAGELAGDYLDVAGGIAEGWRIRDNAENTGEISTALREPEHDGLSDTDKG